MGDITLINLTVFDPEISAEKVLHFAETPGFDPVDDTLEPYEDRIIDAGNYEEYLYKRGTTIGLSETGSGNIKLNNADRGLDGMRKYGYCRAIETLRGTTAMNNPSDFTAVFTGTTQGALTRTETTIQVEINNRLAEIFEKPFTTVKYSGDTTDATYGVGAHVNGTVDDIAGKNRPLLIGDAGGENFPAPVVNVSLSTIQVSKNAVRGIDFVDIGGADQTPGTTHATLTALQAATVSAGHFDSYLGDNTLEQDDPARGCFVRLGSAIDGDVTIKAHEGWANLSTYSEDLTNAAWTKTSVTIPSTTTDAATGSMTLGFIKEAAATSAHQIKRTITTASLALPHWSSFFVQAAVGARTITITLRNASSTGNNVTATFNLQTGTVSTAAAAAGNAAGATAFIYDQGNGLFRICLGCTKVDNSGTGLEVLFTMGAASYAGDGVSGVYMGGAHIETSISVSPYVKTVAAIDYNDSLVNCSARALMEKGIIPHWASFAALDKKFSAKGGIWVDTEEVQTGDILARLQEGYNGYLALQNNGAFKAGRMEDPATGTPVATISTDILSGEEKVKWFPSEDQNGDMPASQILYNYNFNYLVQNEADLPGATSQARKEFLKNAWRTLPLDADPAIITKWPQAVPFTVNALITDPDAAAAEAARQKVLRTTEREFAEIVVHEKYARDINLGDVITIEYAPYSDTGTDNWLVLGRINEFVENTTALILWK